MNNDVKLLWVIPINSCSRRRWLVATFYASLVLGCVFSRLIHMYSGSSVGRAVGLYAVMMASFLLLAACYGALARLLRDYGSSAGTPRTPAGTSGWSKCGTLPTYEPTGF